MLKLKRPWSDGTVAMVFEPEVFVERLAALVPAPQKNQVHTRWRSLLVPDGVRRKKKATARKQSGKPPGFDERWVPWEDLMHRVFGRDVLLHNGCLPGLRKSHLVGRSGRRSFQRTA